MEIQNYLRIQTTHWVDGSWLMRALNWISAKSHLCCVLMRNLAEIQFRDLIKVQPLIGFCLIQMSQRDISWFIMEICFRRHFTGIPSSSPSFKSHEDSRFHATGRPSSSLEFMPGKLHTSYHSETCHVSSHRIRLPMLHVYEYFSGFIS